MHPAGKIKVFVDAHAFDNEHQGTRSYIKRLYTEITKQTDRIEIYFGAKDINNLQNELGELQSVRFIKYRSGFSAIRLLFELPLILRRNKFHLAHFQYISPPFTSVNTIVTTHDVLFLDFTTHFPFLYRITRKYFFGKSLKNASIRTTVSSYSRARISEHFDVDESTIEVVPSGVDESFFMPYDRQNSKNHIKKKFGVKRFILCVSRFEPRKNHGLLLKAFLDLRLYEKNIFLVLLGHNSISSPAFNSQLVELAPDVRKFIHIDDRTGDEDLYHFYRGADAFVYPSLAEGFGLPPIEAGALGVPVLCSNLTAMSDFTFFDPFHIDPNNEARFINAVNEIVHNPPPAEKLIAISEKIKERYLIGRSASLLSEKILGFQ